MIHLLSVFVTLFSHNSETPPPPPPPQINRCKDWSFAFIAFVYLSNREIRSLGKTNAGWKLLIGNKNDVCRFSRDHVVECSESFLLS